MQFRDLKRQYFTLKEDIDKAILSTCERGDFISGTAVSQLEAQLASYTNMKHCITCANGTDALTLALMAWDVGVGDAIFVPNFTFFATAEAPALMGATPVFVDIDSETFNLNPEKLEYAVQEVVSEGKLRPRAVITVDLFGLPADYQKIKNICASHNLLILEDAAQGFGGAIGDRRACSFGDISTTSFFPAKPLGCYGDGGAIFTNDDKWADLIRSYAVHGKGSEKYDNVRIGMNSRLDTIQAAILQIKLKAFQEYELDAVNKAARLYDEGLAGTPLRLPVVPEGFYSSWAQYTVQAPAETDRDRLQQHLKQEGIPTAIYYPKPLHKQTAFDDWGLCFDGGTTSERLSKTVLSLPIDPYLQQEEIDEMVNVLNNFYR